MAMENQLLGFLPFNGLLLGNSLLLKGLRNGPGPIQSSCICSGIALIHWASLEMERKVSKPRNDRETMAPLSQIKRRKIDHTPYRRILSSAGVERQGVPASTKGSTFPVCSGSEFRILHDKSSAVAEAKQDGCTGNFKILDSPFGNFLLPVIPSPAELVE